MTPKYDAASGIIAAELLKKDSLENLLRCVQCTHTIFIQTSYFLQYKEERASIVRDFTVEIICSNIFYCFGDNKISFSVSTVWMANKFRNGMHTSVGCLEGAHKDKTTKYFSFSFPGI
jgi:hypothetical protein